MRVAQRDRLVVVGGRRILLAEDDDAIRLLLTDLLGEAGYEVAAVRNASEALDRALSWKPDLVILDRLMPGGDGTAFAVEYARTDGPRAPIVALCAAIDAAAWASEIGASAYISKPFDIDALLATIAGQLR